MANESDHANTHITNLRGRFRVETINPVNPVEGDMYFNTANNYLMYYDGSNWVGVLFS